MTLQQFIPYIFSATTLSFILVSLSVFVDMTTNTNLESKLMPLKKYIRNFLTIIIFISVLLSAFIHLSLILSGDIAFFKEGGDDNNYLVDYTTLGTIIIITIVIIILMLIVTIFIFFIGKIFEVKAKYFIKELEGEPEWMLVKITYDNKLLLRKTNLDLKREYKILDSLDSKIIEEKIELEGWKKKLYTEWFKTIVALSIIALIVSLGFIGLYKGFNWIGYILVFSFFITSLSTLLFSIGLKNNLKKLGLLN